MTVEVATEEEVELATGGATKVDLEADIVVDIILIVELQGEEDIQGVLEGDFEVVVVFKVQVEDTKLEETEVVDLEEGGLVTDKILVKVYCTLNLKLKKSLKKFSPSWIPW
uniref:Uncharacterized protein n=1 Tax=Micrurus carvalhoi TaxID=3147026 RepID=A0A2H6N4C7_9SAUR